VIPQGKMGDNMYDKLAMQTGQGDGKDREVRRVREINTERTAIANNSVHISKEGARKQNYIDESKAKL
jgi:hypothetical protein